MGREQTADFFGETKEKEREPRGWHFLSLFPEGSSLAIIWVKVEIATFFVLLPSFFLRAVGNLFGQSFHYLTQKREGAREHSRWQTVAEGEG